MSAILLVTWFYYGQSQASSQVQFPSLDACQAAREAVLQDAARLKANAEAEVEAKRRQGIIYNPIIPTVCVVCATLPHLN